MHSASVLTWSLHPLGVYTHSASVLTRSLHPLGVYMHLVAVLTRSLHLFFMFDCALALVLMMSKHLFTAKQWFFGMYIGASAVADKGIFGVFLGIMAYWLITDVLPLIIGCCADFIMAICSVSEIQVRDQLRGGGHRSTAKWLYYDVQKFQVKGQTFSPEAEFIFLKHISKKELSHLHRFESDIVTVLPLPQLQDLTRTQLFDIATKHGIPLKKLDNWATMV